MKIKYYGTAAAEGIPAIFCECEVCKKARERGGKNVRTRSQAIIDDTILIDLPADTYMHCLNGLPIEKLHTCIITHSHGDHLYATEILNRGPGMARVVLDDKPFNMYGTAPAMRFVRDAINRARLDTCNRVSATIIAPFEPFEAEGYKITPLKAVHDAYASPVIYALEKDGKSMLYAHDTGIFAEETFDYIEKNNMHFDFVSLDCTFCDSPNDWLGHMSIGNCNVVRDRLNKIGCTDENTVFAVNHFSHNNEHALYDDLKPIAEENGYIISYDGLEIEF